MLPSPSLIRSQQVHYNESNGNSSPLPSPTPPLADLSPSGYATCLTMHVHHNLHTTDFASSLKMQYFLKALSSQIMGIHYVCIKHRAILYSSLELKHFSSYPVSDKLIEVFNLCRQNRGTLSGSFAFAQLMVIYGFEAAPLKRVLHRFSIVQLNLDYTPKQTHSSCGHHGHIVV